MNYDTNILAMRRHEMNAALVHLFSHTKDYVAKNINNKVLAFVNHIESELNTTKKELAVAHTEIERLRKAGLDTWSELRQRIHKKDAEITALKKTIYFQNNRMILQIQIAGHPEQMRQLMLAGRGRRERPPDCRSKSTRKSII